MYNVLSNLRVSVFCRNVFVWLVLVILVLAPVNSGAQQPSSELAWMRILDVPYIPDGDPKQDLRIYRPEDILIGLARKSVYYTAEIFIGCQLAVRAMLTLKCD